MLEVDRAGRVLVQAGLEKRLIEQIALRK